MTSGLICFQAGPDTCSSKELEMLDKTFFPCLVMDNH